MPFTPGYLSVCLSACLSDYLSLICSIRQNDEIPAGVVAAATGVALAVSAALTSTTAASPPAADVDAGAVTGSALWVVEGWNGIGL